MQVVASESFGNLAHIRLNCPENGNRISMEMFRALGTMFSAFDADPDIRCTLLSAAGTDFSLGVDVADVLPSWAAGKSPFEDHQINPFGTTGPRRRKPLVTVVQGRCFNAGLELVLASDICVAADDARFAFHEMRFGVYPFGGGLFRLIRAAGSGSFACRSDLRQRAARGAGGAGTGPDLGRSGRSRGAGAFGSGYHPTVELARRGGSDASDGGRTAAEIRRAVTQTLVAMNAASASRSFAAMVSPSLVRRHRISSGKRAHSLAMR
jgi:hypothetical protein